MNLEAAKIVSDGLLKGAFDVFGAMFSRTFALEADTPQPFTAELAAAFPVTFQTRTKSKLGSVAMLFSTADAGCFSGLISGTGATAKTALDAEDLDILKEIAEPALGGGVSNLMERFGRGVEQLDAVEVLPQADTAQLLALLGAEASACRYTFSSDDFEGTGWVAFSQSLEALVPANLLSANGRGPSLSKAEVSDILSGFDVPPAPPVMAPPTPGRAGKPGHGPRYPAARHRAPGTGRNAARRHSESRPGLHRRGGPSCG